MIIKEDQTCHETTAAPRSDDRPDANHDQAADRMEPLYRQHSAAVFRRLLRLTLGDRREAEDYLQETFLRTWKHLQRGSIDPSTAKAWLFTVARNVVIDAARAKRSRPSEVYGDTTLVAEPINDIDRMLLRHTVTQSLKSLSSRHRDALIEAYYHDRSAQEAAQVLGVPEGTVKSRIHYGLRSMRRDRTMSMAES